MNRVQVGQVYMDNDPRTHNTRTLQVTTVKLVTAPKSMKGNYGLVAEFADCDVYRNGVKTGTTRIHTARMMKPSSNGYRLMDIHSLPIRERELKYADGMASIVSSLLEAPANDIGYHLRTLNAALVAYHNVRVDS